jgi:RNA polymerase sigma-70 factor (ECF subfamily)
MILGGDAHRAAEHAAREHYSRLLASLAARFRDVSAAEDALADSLVAALAQWPVSGVPDEPAAWLLTVARRRHSDRLRRQTTARAALDQLAFDPHSANGSPMNDRRLDLLFACAHPAINENMRAPLMLQVVFGLDAGEIAGLFLVAPAAMAQRLVRAKQKIRHAHIPFHVPGPDAYPERLDFVLQAIYALFTRDGALWHEATGNRDSLAEEAIWLGDLVVGLSHRHPEALGLLALMLFVESRRGARRDAQGRYVPLSRQSVALWDLAMIGRAENLLREAAAMSVMGKFQLEAAIQSVHCARAKTGTIDWPAIRALYEGILALGPTLVAEINRAVTILHVNGAEAALSALDQISSDRITAYQPYWAARAHILEECGHRDDAITSCDRAIALKPDEAAKDFLRHRLQALG